MGKTKTKTRVVKPKAKKVAKPKVLKSKVVKVKVTKAKVVKAKVVKPKTPRVKKAVSKMEIEDIISTTSTATQQEFKEELYVESTKYHIGVEHNAHSLPSQEIPPEYGVNKVMLLVVDPKFVFTYWEIRHETLADAARRAGRNPKLTLRFYDITATGDPAKSHYWDVDIFDRLGNWYLKLSHTGQRLCLDVGMKGDSGEFVFIARSNIMHLPPESLAPPGPIRWMVVTPSGDKLISHTEEYTEADLALLKKILGPYFFNLLMKGRFASISGSSLEAIFYDVQSLSIGESPTDGPSWAK